MASGESVKEFLGLSADADVPESLYAIIPKTDCPHISQMQPFPDALNKTLDIKAPCIDCQKTAENWLCLCCYKVYCSRYCESHMLKHYESSKHALALSYSDISAWCYECDSYVVSDNISEIKKMAHLAKFGSEMPSGSN